MESIHWLINSYFRLVQPRACTAWETPAQTVELMGRWQRLSLKGREAGRPSRAGFVVGVSISLCSERLQGSVKISLLGLSDRLIKINTFYLYLSRQFILIRNHTFILAAFRNLFNSMNHLLIPFFGTKLKLQKWNTDLFSQVLFQKPNWKKKKKKMTHFSVFDLGRFGRVSQFGYFHRPWVAWNGREHNPCVFFLLYFFITKQCHGLICFDRRRDWRTCSPAPHLIIIILIIKCF